MGKQFEFVKPFNEKKIMSNMYMHVSLKKQFLNLYVYMDVHVKDFNYKT